MTKEEFVKVMGYAGVIYHREFTPLEINAWYEFFRDITFNICKAAIKNCTIKNKYMPAISELLEECKIADMQLRNQIVDKMYASGYFKEGVEELTPEHELQNYYKAQYFIAQNIIPSWFLEDMIKYGYKEMLLPNASKQLTAQRYLPEV